MFDILKFMRLIHWRQE